jgi:hypothetical protein
VDGKHRLFRATSDVKDSEGHVVVTAYPLLRPDGQWSVLLVNKDYDNPRHVQLVFHDPDVGKELFLAESVTMLTFGKNQYQWHSEKDGYADPENPALKSVVIGGAEARYALPPASITALRGHLAETK